MRTSPKTLLLVTFIALAILFVARQSAPLLVGQRVEMGQPSAVRYSAARPRSAALPGQEMRADLGAADMAIAPVPPVPNGHPVQGGEMFITDTSLSLVSRDPAAVEQRIRQVTAELGGFLVSSTLSRPEEGTTATVTVRVPTDQRDEALRQFEEAGDRVIHKSVQGTDVTQAYQDIEAKLATLNATQARLETLLNQATEPSDLLQIQQQISQIQNQKDALEGQRRYFTEAANLSLVTIYVASDELALPYVPAEPWQPEAIFRQAVRSVMFTVRGVGTVLIWAVVYLPLFLPVIALVWWLNRPRRS